MQHKVINSVKRQIVYVTDERKETFMKNQNLDNYEKYFVPQNEDILPIDTVKVTFFGATTLLFDDGENQILIDGMVTRPSLFKVLTSKLETDKSLVDHILKRENIKQLRAIFVSHSHYDHALDISYIANKTKAKIYGSRSTINIGRGGNVPEDNLSAINSYDQITVGKFTVTVLPSIHSKPTIFNNDIGVVIESPLRQPAKMREYTEGGSFDFLIQYKDKKILIRPSFNYIEGALDDIRADVLFLGIGGLGKADTATKRKFYEEIVEKVEPKLIVPIHWDNFFLSLDKPLRGPMRLIDNLSIALDYMIKRTEEDNISFKLLQGFQCIELFCDDNYNSLYDIPKQA